jgi:hypothetical protein
MASKLFAPLVVVVATLLPAGAALAADRPNVEYSADQVIEAEAGAMKARVYSTPTKERRNESGQDEHDHDRAA